MPIKRTMIRERTTPESRFSSIKTGGQEYIKEKYEDTGAILSRTVTYKNALDEFTKAEKFVPINELVVYSNKTTALFFLGNHHESLEYANKALGAYDRLPKLDKANPEARYRLKIIYRNAAGSFCFLGKREQALQSAEKLVQLFPYDYGSYATKGMVLARLGYVEDAIKSYEKAIEMNPRDRLIRQERDKLMGRSVVK